MLTVLHADRGTFFNNLFKNIFVEQGFNFISFNKAHDVLNYLSKNKVDLILTATEFDDYQSDQYLNNLIETQTQDIPIILLTGHDTISLRMKMFSNGIIDFISKENAVTRIKDYIEKLIEDDNILSSIRQVKIAVVDDSMVELGVIKRIFNLYQIKSVDYFNNATDLLKSDNKYSIYIIDIIMPEISGEQIITEIRKRDKEAVIIAVSALSHYKNISNIFLLGANDYILKPFNASVFMPRIKSNFRTFSLLQDIKIKNDLLEQMVITDGLTSLYNHKYSYERLEREISNAKRHRHNLSIIMLDIDHFKIFNDKFGHQAGDIVLERTSDAIRESLREIDIAGRYGGEEFIVILPESDLDGALVVANRIRNNIKSIEVKFESYTAVITASLGVVQLSDETALTIVSKADKLLYKAKDNGRDRIES